MKISIALIKSTLRKGESMKKQKVFSRMLVLLLVISLMGNIFFIFKEEYRDTSLNLFKTAILDNHNNHKEDYYRDITKLIVDSRPNGKADPLR